MIFEFLKRLFWKADEGSRKRKASDSAFVEEDKNYSKRHCDNFVSSNHIKIIHNTSDYLNTKYTNTNCNYYSPSLLKLHKSENNTSDTKNVELIEPRNPWSVELNKENTMMSSNDCTAVQKSEPTNYQTLFNSHRLAEKKQYGEMLLNFIPFATQKPDHDLKKFMNKEQKIKSVNINTPSTSKVLNPNSVKLDAAIETEFYKPRIHATTILNRSQKHNTHIVDLEAEDNKQMSRGPTRNVPVEIIKTNTLRDKFSTNEFMKEDFVSQINKKYNERMQRQNKEVEELKKITYILSKHNQVIRETALEDHLNRSMRLYEAVLDETDILEEPKLPELSSDMMKRVQRALSAGSADEVLVQDFGLKITRKDIQTLAGLNWLNDEIINFYMNLLITRGNNEKYPNVYAMNTFFYPRLVSSGHASLKRWTRKIDIFSKDLLVVPIHLGIHWCMSIIDFRNKSIQYYDSMGSPNYKCLQVLKQYLFDESVDKKKKSFDFVDWTFDCMKDIPQQMNGSDCGVFSCMFAEYICANKKLNFSQEDMPYFRNKMVYEILTAQLL